MTNDDIETLLFNLNKNNIPIKHRIEIFKSKEYNIIHGAVPYRIDSIDRELTAEGYYIQNEKGIYHTAIIIMHCYGIDIHILTLPGYRSKGLTVKPIREIILPDILDYYGIEEIVTDFRNERALNHAIKCGFKKSGAYTIKYTNNGE